jgi:DNA-binding NtrC family response regulator
MEIPQKANIVVEPRWLPNAKQETFKTNQTTLASSFTQGSRRRILVIDDDANVRDILSQGLSFMGYNVAVANCGDEGLNLFQKSSFDLVITDLDMPGMDGWNLAFRIKEKSPNTPVVLITGKERRAVLEKIKDSSVDFALFKPFRLEDIQKMVQSMLDTRSSEYGTRAPAKEPAVTKKRMRLYSLNKETHISAPTVS